jgi:tetratricopeptide (TPR) repeat protein
MSQEEDKATGEEGHPQQIAGPPRAVLVEDIIPFPVLVWTFVCLILLVILLLSPNWLESMRAVMARRESRAGDFKTAVSYYETLARMRPNNPSYLGELAYAYAALGRHQEAVEKYQKATEVLLAQPPPSDDDRGAVAPTPDHYAGVIGASYFMSGNFAEAKTYLERFLRSNKLDGLSHYYMAQIYLKENNVDLAAAHLGAAKVAGLSDERLAPVRQALLEKRLPSELR